MCVCVHMNVYQEARVDVTAAGKSINMQVTDLKNRCYLVLNVSGLHVSLGVVQILLHTRLEFRYIHIIDYFGLLFGIKCHKTV